MAWVSDIGGGRTVSIATVGGHDEARACEEKGQNKLFHVRPGNVTPRPASSLRHECIWHDDSVGEAWVARRDARYCEYGYCDASLSSLPQPHHS